MHLFAVTGGIASGKSTVSAALADLGCPIIDADLIARQGKKWAVWLDVSALCRLICDDMACSYGKCNCKGGDFWTWPKLSLFGSSLLTAVRHWKVCW